MLIAIWVSQRPLRATVTRRVVAVACRPRRPDPARVPACTTRPGSVRGERRSSTAATAPRSGSTVGSVLAHSGHRRRECDPDAAARRVRRRAARHRTDRPVLADRRHPPHRPDVDRARPPEGLRPRRPAGRGTHGRERVGAAPRHRRSDVGVRVDARVRPRRRPAHDPLADDGPHRHADGSRTRRGSPARVHRRRSTPRRRSARPTTSRRWSTSPRAWRSTRSARDSTSWSAPPTATHAGRPIPVVAESMVLDLLTPVQQSPDDELLSVASLFAGGFDHTSVLMVTGPTGPSSRFGDVERMTVVRVGEGATGGARDRAHRGRRRPSSSSAGGSHIVIGLVANQDRVCSRAGRRSSCSARMRAASSTRSSGR